MVAGLAVAAIYAMVAVNGMVMVYSCHGNCMYCMIRIGSTYPDIGELGKGGCNLHTQTKPFGPTS